MKYILLVLLISISSVSHANEFSAWATPTEVHIENDSGFMVLGKFGNPLSCGVSNQIFIYSGNPQYASIYSSVLTALVQKREVKFNIGKCEMLRWISASDTYSTVSFSFDTQFGIR